DTLPLSLHAALPIYPVVLQVLEQDPAVPVNDGLRQPGRPRGEEHVQGVVERDRVELERAGLGAELLPRDRVGKNLAAVGDMDDRSEEHTSELQSLTN